MCVCVYAHEMEIALIVLLLIATALIGYYWRQDVKRRTILSRQSQKDPLCNEETALDSLCTMRRYSNGVHVTLSGRKCYTYYCTDSRFENHGIAFGPYHTFGVRPTNEDIVAAHYVKLFCHIRLAILYRLFDNSDCSRLVALYIYDLLKPVDWYGIRNLLYLSLRDGVIPFYATTI